GLALATVLDPHQSTLTRGAAGAALLVGILTAGIGVKAIAKAGEAGVEAATQGAGRAASSAERFYIQNGVRRSLAVREAGLGEVPATIYRPGQAPVTTTLKLDQLFSPKGSVSADARFLRIQPPIYTPIEVEPLGLSGQLPSIPIL